MGKAPSKRAQVLSEIRKRIVEGDYAPGSKLPVRRDLETMFAAGRPTVQNALDQLAQEGFVFARGSLGTFVAEHPPHLSHYVIPFPEEPARSGNGEWSRFMLALANEATLIGSRRQQKLSVRYRIDAKAKSPEYLELAEELESHRVAGIILPSAADERTVPLLQFEVPYVVMSPALGPNVPAAVWPDWESWYRRAWEYLRKQGCTRVGVITTWLEDVLGMHHWADEMGIEVRECWHHAVYEYYTQWAKNIAALMFKDSQTERPDGLIIADDNLVQHTAAGLSMAGVRVPDDVVVVAHANYPWQVSSMPGVKLLGFDVRQLLEACIHSIDRQRTGEKHLGVTLIPPLFDNEVSGG